jgi:hypothetical protein
MTDFKSICPKRAQAKTRSRTQNPTHNRAEYDPTARRWRAGARRGGLRTITGTSGTAGLRASAKNAVGCPGARLPETPTAKVHARAATLNIMTNPCR